MPSSGPIYEFGGFTLDIQERRLWNGSTVVPLTPKLLDTLALLLREHGRLVAKESFMQEVWPDVIVSDATLAHNISALSQAAWAHGRSSGDRNCGEEGLPVRGAGSGG